MTSNDPAPRLESGISSMLLRAASVEHRHNTMLTLILALTIALAASVVLNVWQYTRPTPQPKYFSATEDGRLIEFLPLADPINAGAKVTRFATDVVGCVKNLDAVHAEVQLEACRDYFSPATFQQLLDDMGREGVLVAIKQAGAIQDVSPSAPTIEAQGVNPDGRYTYQLEVPVRIGITSGRASKAYRDGVVTLRLTRVDTRQRSSGLIVTGYNEQLRSTVAPTLPVSR